MFIRVVAPLSRGKNGVLLFLDFSKYKDIQPGCPTHVLGVINAIQKPSVGMEEYTPLYTGNDKNKMLSSEWKKRGYSCKLIWGCGAFKEFLLTH